MKYSDSPSRKQRLHFDDYSSQFYFDTPAEAIAKICEQRQRTMQNANRCQQQRLEMNLKRFEALQQIFESKVGVEMDSARAYLKDITAHHKVLKNIAKMNECNEKANANYGIYGLSAGKEELLPLIENEKKKMCPQYREKQRVNDLLKQRRSMPAMDRTQETEMLFKKWQNYLRLSEGSGRDSKYCYFDRNCQLILPPIQASPKIHVSACRHRVHGSMDISPHQSESAFLTDADSEW